LGATSDVDVSPRTSASSAGPVDRGVLADFERGEVEAEGCQLPAKVLDLAPRDPVEAVAGERGLQLGELVVELVGCVIAPGQRSGLPR
jgi:hypothetical protein